MGFRSWLSGNKRKIENPEFFGPGTVGGGWSDYLKNLYATETTDTPQFAMQSTSLRDLLSRNSAAQGEQITQASNAGGFYDSGARVAGLGDINRNQMASYSQGLTEILSRLEEQKLAAAYPFMQSQIGGWTAYQDQLYRQDELQTQRKKQIAQTFGSVFGSASGGGGGYEDGGGGYE